jgi:hypothetical protein
MRRSHAVSAIAIALVVSGCRGPAPMVIHTRVTVTPSKTTIAATFPSDPQCENGDDVKIGDFVGSQLLAVQAQLSVALTLESKWLPVRSIHTSQAD